jgi:uncharacterized membrane protein YoaK (UPF0700 family)
MPPRQEHRDDRLPSVPFRRAALLLWLTWAAGNVDAISYLGLDHVFTAMMTGNTVLLGLAVGQGDVFAALRSMLALGGFLAGVALGAVIVETGGLREEWPPAVTAALALEALALGIFAVIWHLAGPERGAGIVAVLIGLSGLAMGIQSAAVRRLGVPGIATTYITGTLTSLVVDLIGWLRSRAVPIAARPAAGHATANWEQRVGLLAGVFVFYGLGALVGGILQARASPLVTVAPLVAVVFVVVSARLRARRR